MIKFLADGRLALMLDHWAAIALKGRLPRLFFQFATYTSLATRDMKTFSTPGTIWNLG